MCSTANYVLIAEKNDWPPYVFPGPGGSSSLTKDDVISDENGCTVNMMGFPMPNENCDCSDPDNFTFKDEGKFRTAYSRKIRL